MVSNKNKKRPGNPGRFASIKRNAFETAHWTGVGHYPFAFSKCDIGAGNKMVDFSVDALGFHGGKAIRACFGRLQHFPRVTCRAVHREGECPFNAGDFCLSRINILAQFPKMSHTFRWFNLGCGAFHGLTPSGRYVCRKLYRQDESCASK